MGSSRNGVARGSVISHLRDKPSSKVRIAPRENRGVDGAATPHDRHNLTSTIVERGGQVHATSSEVAPEVTYPKEFFRKLVDDYTNYVYVVNPIITPQEILLSIDRMDQPDHLVDYALVHACAAVTLNLTKPNWQVDQAESSRIHELLGLASKGRETLMRRSMSLHGPSIHPNLSAQFIMTAIFIEICLMAVDKFSEAFMILREAIAMIQLLGVDHLVSGEQRQNTFGVSQRFAANSELSPAERSRRIRLYWEAFIHERFLAVVACYPPILPPLPREVSLEIDDSSISSHVNIGWQYLIQLWAVLDDEFIESWIRNGTVAPRSVTAGWIQAKMHYLAGLYDGNLEPSRGATYSFDDQTPETMASRHGDITTAEFTLTTLQKADLIITRQWLLMMLWQLAISNLPLASHAASNEPMAMSLQFPARLTRELRQVVVTLGMQSVERHGSSIIKKLFEITNSLADVILHVFTDSDEETSQRTDDFTFLLEFLQGCAPLPLYEVQMRILGEKSLAVKAVRHRNYVS
ncbi:hypothetical protein TruAng_009832 [Truncatella angustata]|nr:hypothetical protein TruAng_009832 [Truncatella angustata]